ncbi:hypothetical protein ACN28C_04905 [Plantactinospora sp. WMMC1484]
MAVAWAGRAGASVVSASAPGAVQTSMRRELKEAFMDLLVP